MAAYVVRKEAVSSQANIRLREHKKKSKGPVSLIVFKDYSNKARKTI